MANKGFYTPVPLRGEPVTKLDLTQRNFDESYRLHNQWSDRLNRLEARTPSDKQVLTWIKNVLSNAAAGVNTSIQFNTGGAFDGNDNFTWDGGEHEIQNDSSSGNTRYSAKNDISRSIQIRIDGSTVPGNVIGITSADLASIRSSGAGMLLLQLTNDPMYFATNSTVRARILGSGEMGIGEASPQTTLHIGGGVSYKTTRVTSGPYTVLIADHVIYFDTDSAAITVNLTAGTAGRNLKLINCGSSGNNLSVVPNGAELIKGANSTYPLLDGEDLDITYESTEGWW
jgi:hypothetical protein